MSRQEINNITDLLDLMNYLVNEMEGTWKVKRTKILNAANKADEVNILEFCTWFDLEDDGA
jgi:hypothetical protein